MNCKPLYIFAGIFLYQLHCPWSFRSACNYVRDRALIMESYGEPLNFFLQNLVTAICADFFTYASSNFILCGTTFQGRFQ